MTRSRLLLLLPLAVIFLAMLSTQADAQDKPPLREQVDILREKIDLIDERQDGLSSFQDKILIPVTILVSVLAGGGVIGAILSLRAEARTNQLHGLSVSREAVSQVHSEQVHSNFLEGSQKTLTLVNDTLRLAKEASESAAGAMTLKARQVLHDINERGQTSLSAVLLSADFKALVKKKKLRSVIEELAGELSSLEGYLQLQSIKLEPLAFFIRGIASHLKQEPHAARGDLQNALKEADPDLRAFAQYWIGYESNNLGKYTEASEIFRRGQEAERPGSARYFEFSRILYESQYFRVARDAETLPPTQRLEAISSLLESWRGMLSEIENKRDADLSPISQTIHSAMGNAYAWVAHDLEGFVPSVDDLDRQEALRVSRGHFEQAGDSMFARFGLVEASFARTHRANDEDYEAIEYMAVDDLTNRVEPRSLANLHQTRLIAQGRRRELGSLPATYQLLRSSLQDVEEDITIYSQFRRRNVEWGEFESESRLYYDMLMASPTKAV